MPNSLSQFLEAGASDSTRPLPLTHCTTVASAIMMLDEGEIRPTRCPVYESDLLYLFYGRPAYKPAENFPASRLVELMPICLVIDPEIVERAARILPFDSGGFSRYSALIGPRLNLAHFELGLDRLMPSKLIAAFYQSTRNYYDQRPTLAEESIGISKLAARAYARLIADPSIREVDDRCGTIEVQLKRSVSLSNHLRAIVAPAQLFDDPDMIDALERCPKAVPMPYKTYGRSTPAAFSGTIYEKVETLFESMGVFS